MPQMSDGVSEWNNMLLNMGKNMVRFGHVWVNVVIDVSCGFND